MSVETWLESLGLSHIKEALSDVGITTPTDLVMLHGSDLRTLAKGIKLDGMSELKLIVAVNKLQIKDTRVVVTPQEDEAMRKLTKRINETRNSLDVLQDLVQKTKLCSKKSRKSVNLEFDAFFEELKKRKAALLGTIDKEEKMTLDTLEGQVRKLSDLLFQLREAKLECDKYLMISSVDSLDSRTKKVGEQVIEAVNLKPPENLNISAEIRYVSNADKLSKILRTHGEIAKGSLPAVPVIKSHEATRNEISFMLEDQQGVVLKGECDLKGQHEILEYCVSVSQSEQKQEEGSQEDTFEKLFKADTKMFKLSDLHQKTEYLVRIKAKNSIGWSQPSERISIQTTASNLTARPLTPTEYGTVYEFYSTGTGPLGPSQTMCDCAYNGTSLERSVQIRGSGIQRWIVPHTATYTLNVCGARGGTGQKAKNKSDIKTGGAIMFGEFELTKGTILDILVGQEGPIGDHRGGGGGGTFVVTREAKPLIIAGGGGGVCDCFLSNNNLSMVVGGRTTKKGGAGNSDSENTSSDGQGGSSIAYGGSGAGLSGDGSKNSTAKIGISKSFFNGGAGGTGAIGRDQISTPGGFGGGGTGYSCSAGGGGGYTGGNGISGSGGGGGSLNTGRSQINKPGANNGPGRVMISAIMS